MYVHLPTLGGQEFLHFTDKETEAQDSPKGTKRICGTLTFALPSLPPQRGVEGPF